jgi:hypothetical protein
VDDAVLVQVSHPLAQLQEDEPHLALLEPVHLQQVGDAGRCHL